MMDRAIGRPGCAVAALLALKLFGGRRRVGVDWGEALDSALEDELDDDIQKPW
jgi:hypothetical protein